MNNFDECLAKSHAASDLPLWEEVYRKAFPGYLTIVDHRQDGEHQRAGIDRSIILANSKQILIDEKIRGRNAITGRVYEDIALEYLSNDRTGSPGWVCKPLRCDYIAYAIGPLGICYLMPVIQLQIAWQRNGEKWIKYYPKIKSINRTYNTISCGVPPAVLFPAIGGALWIKFAKIEIEDNP